MRVLVTGSRQWRDRPKMYARLDEALGDWIAERMATKSRDAHVGEFTIIEGAAAGADTMAGEWVYDRRMELHPPSLEVHPADWSNNADGFAGRRRNLEMIQSGPDLVLGFLVIGAPNVGTRHCLTEAHRWLDHRHPPVLIEEIWSDL